MMMVNGKQLNRRDRVWLDTDGAAIDTRPYIEQSERTTGLSRRQQALIAAAGEIGSARSWFIIKVKPNRENDVDKSLSAHLIDHWLPLVKGEQVHHGGRAGEKNQPFWVRAWPGYLFIRIPNTAEAWAGIRSIKHTVAVLGDGEAPFQIPEDMLLNIKAELATLKAVGKNAALVFRKDEQVRVADGPFASFPGTVAELGDGKREGRAMVEVMIFGRAVPVDLELAQLEKV